MLEIQKITLEKNLKYKSSIILKYSISYPKINSNTYIYGVEKFNHFNQIKDALIQKGYRILSTVQ